jgi:predicted metal-dependent enzyme (double-stranded beta helix superfamily)
MTNHFPKMQEPNKNNSDWDWPYITGLLSAQFNLTREILSEAGVTCKALKSLSIPSIHKEEPYGRYILHRGDRFEVMLASWSRGAECAPHDHGFSNGVVWLLDGDFRETHYELEKNLAVLGKSVLRPHGTLLAVTPGDIHSMVALDGGVSLHIYTPPIEQMKVFDPNGRRTLIVNGDCGAWVPSSTAQILQEIQWP